MNYHVRRFLYVHGVNPQVKETKMNLLQMKLNIIYWGDE
jgi:hypothetical protein